MSSTSKTLAGGTSGKAHPNAPQLACLAGHVRVTGAGTGATNLGNHLRDLIWGDGMGVSGLLWVQAHSSFTLREVGWCVEQQALGLLTRLGEADGTFHLAHLLCENLKAREVPSS